MSLINSRSNNMERYRARSREIDQNEYVHRRDSVFGQIRVLTDTCRAQDIDRFFSTSYILRTMLGFGVGQDLYKTGRSLVRQGGVPRRSEAS
jgi:putative salt-induced outer membrane protein YdiY